MHRRTNVSIRQPKFPITQSQWSASSDSFSEFFADQPESVSHSETTSFYPEYSSFAYYPDNVEGDEDWESLMDMGVSLLDSVRLAFPEMGEMDDSMIEAEL